MYEFLIILIIWIVDLPLHEDHPFFWVAILWRILKEKYEIIDFDRKMYLETYQAIYEYFYLNKIGQYEFRLFRTILFVILKLQKKTWIAAMIALFITVLYNWWFNLKLITYFLLLPVFFYYFFILMDYLEVFEELMAYIRGEKV